MRSDIMSFIKRDDTAKGSPPSLPPPPPPPSVRHWATEQRLQGPRFHSISVDHEYGIRGDPSVQLERESELLSAPSWQPKLVPPWVVGLLSSGEQRENPPQGNGTTNGTALGYLLQGC